MKFLLLLLVLLVVVGVLVLRRRRGGDVVTEVDQFSRARQMTTSWSQGGWNGPPRSPAEARRDKPTTPAAPTGPALPADGEGTAPGSGEVGPDSLQAPSHP